MSIHFKHIITAVFAGVALCSCAGSKSRDTASAQTGTQPPIPSVKAEFNADSAYAYTARQVEFGPRVPGSEAHTACRNFIVSQMSAAGADTVGIQSGTMTAASGKNVPVANIFARFNPDKKKRVLLLAHYDSRPWADNDPDKSNHNKPVDGANDGASGVGVLLEIARQLGLSKPEIGVDFLFTDAEDMGVSGPGGSEESWCLGTQMWTRQLPYTAADMPAYGILLDMVGDTDAVFRREYISDRFARAVNERVWAIAKASGYASRFADGQGGAVTDDHIFIIQAGIPCIDIVDCVNPATGSFPASWHTTDDNMKHISPATLKAVGQTVLNTITSEKP